MTEKVRIRQAVNRGDIEAVRDHLQTLPSYRHKDEFCHDSARTAAHSRQWEMVQFLAQSINDGRKRDTCCFETAQTATMCKQWPWLNVFVQAISNRETRDLCCQKIAPDAARNEQWDLVRFLVQEAANPTVKDQLRAAGSESASKFAQWDVRREIANQDIRDECCSKVLRTAAAKHQWDFVRLVAQLIQCERKRDRSCVETAKSAAKDGQQELVRFLVQQIGDQSLRDRCCMEASEAASNARRWPLINSASRRRNLLPKSAFGERSNFLVMTVVDQRSRDQCCKDAVKSAASECKWELVRSLVSAISDPNISDQCCIEAAKCSASVGKQEIVEFLFHALKNPDSQIAFRRECAVAACCRLREEFVAFLGVEPDWLFEFSHVLSFTASMAIEGRNSVLKSTLSKMNPDRITQLLCLSISHCHVSLALTLMDDERFSKEHVDVPDSSGATALMLAADSGHHELIDKLLDLGASVRAQDHQGRTALTRACEAGHIRTAKLLKDRGANADHRDGQGLTCTQLAERLGHSQLLRLLCPEKVRFKDDVQQDEQLSEELHQLLSKAGFTSERAECQQRMACLLEGVAKTLTEYSRKMTGSYAEGWANSLMQVNGRTAADSDIDWTVLVRGQTFHLEDGCGKFRECNNVEKLKVAEGHAQPACCDSWCIGVRPALDTCHAIECCSSFCEDRIEKLIKNYGWVHLVRATRPSSTNELRGQLFTIIKFIFKRHLPLNLSTPGLKSYHAKTLLFFMLEKHGMENGEAWKPQKLISLIKESLSMLLSFIDKSNSADVCMPHFFMPGAPLYFKNAGIGGDFDNTKARIRSRLSELRGDISGVLKQLKVLVRPLESENFYFHPFTLLPLTASPAEIEIRSGMALQEQHSRLARVYQVLHQCLDELQSESSDRDTLTGQLGQLDQLPSCKYAAMCLAAIVSLRFGETAESERILMELQKRRVKSGLSPREVQTLDTDWAWRFCLPCHNPPHFPFLPGFTQSLFTARLSQPSSSHLYVNFRCLSWSLQAELLHDRSPIVFGEWLEDLQEDPDLEELLTLAHYSDCREHVMFCLEQMEIIRDERRVAMDTRTTKRFAA
uniref:ANK_REP_REGION domain-containing protein n=1 Tax=Macrostomum lignano TaxID=282301 RepID=A0A1I8I451_9PLAT